MAKTDEQLNPDGTPKTNTTDDKDKGGKGNGQPKGKGTSDDKNKGNADERLIGQIKALQNQIKEKDTQITDLSGKFTKLTETLSVGLGIKKEEGQEVTLDDVVKGLAETNNRITGFQNEQKLAKILDKYDKLSPEAKTYIESHIDKNAEDLEKVVDGEVKALEGIMGVSENNGNNNNSAFNAYPDKRPFSAGQMQPKTFDKNVGDANEILSALEEDKEE